MCSQRSVPAYNESTDAQLVFYMCASRSVPAYNESTDANLRSYICAAMPAPVVQWVNRFVPQGPVLCIMSQLMPNRSSAFAPQRPAPSQLMPIWCSRCVPQCPWYNESTDIGLYFHYHGYINFCCSYCNNQHNCCLYFTCLFSIS